MTDNSLWATTLMPICKIQNQIVHTVGVYLLLRLGLVWFSLELNTSLVISN